MNKEKILQIIYKSIDQLNEQHSEDNRVEKHLDTPLIGKGSSIDSLGFVTLIVSIEDYIEEQCNHSMTLMSDHSDQEATSPLRTVSTLSDHIYNAIKDKHTIGK